MLIYCCMYLAWFTVYSVHAEHPDFAVNKMQEIRLEKDIAGQ